MNRKHAGLLLALAALLLYLLHGSDSISKKVQSAIGAAYADAVELAASFLFFLALGLVLLALDLPLLAVVAIIVVVSYVAYKVAGWFSWLFGGSTAAPAALPTTGGPGGTVYASDGWNILGTPPGTVGNTDGSFTLPVGCTINSDGTVTCNGQLYTPSQPNVGVDAITGIE